MKSKNLPTSIYILISVIFFLLLFSVSYGQSSYNGGQGGGYASTSISVSTSIVSDNPQPAKAFDFSIYPNPIRSDQTLKAKIQGIDANEKIILLVTDMIGSKVFKEEVEVSSEISINLPMEKLKKGIYLITIQYKHQKLTRRFSFTE